MITVIKLIMTPHLLPSKIKVGIHRQVFNEETVTLGDGTAFTDNYLGRLEFLFEGEQVCSYTRLHSQFFVHTFLFAM